MNTKHIRAEDIPETDTHTNKPHSVPHKNGRWIIDIRALLTETYRHKPGARVWIRDLVCSAAPFIVLFGGTGDGTDQTAAVRISETIRLLNTAGLLIPESRLYMLNRNSSLPKADIQNLLNCQYGTDIRFVSPDAQLCIEAAQSGYETVYITETEPPAQGIRTIRSLEELRAPVTVRFYQPDEIPDSSLLFAVTCCRHNGKWVFCKHKKRATIEASGGHREIGETIAQTAERELREETGADVFTLTQIGIYSVTGVPTIYKDGRETFGMLYYADIFHFKPLDPHFEMEKILFYTEPPADRDEWTYPDIQPVLCRYITEYEKTLRRF